MSPRPAPPVARREEWHETLHGVEVTDPYHWLEAASSPETEAYQDAFDRYSRADLDRLPGRDALTARIKQLSGIERRGAPIVRGERRFFWMRAAGAERQLWYVQDGDGAAQVLLDPAKLGPDQNSELRGVWPSYDGKYVAYKVGYQGGDQGVVGVREVATGKVLVEIPGTRYAHPAFRRDGTGFYYVRLPVDAASIPEKELVQHAKVFFHDLGGPWEDDEEVYGEPARDAFLGTSASADGRWLFVQQYHSYSRSDVWFRSQEKGARFAALAVGVDARFDCMAWGDALYVRTNYQAPNWRLMRVDPKHPELTHWREIVAERPDAVLDAAQIIGGKLALTYLRNVSSELTVSELDGSGRRAVALPGLVSARFHGEPDQDVATVEITGFTEPYSLYELKLSGGEPQLSFRPQAALDPNDFVTEFLSYSSKDGTPISMFVVTPKASHGKGPIPLLLTGYGGFGYSVIPRFDGFWLGWLEGGGALALPHLRGGGEYGDGWHKAGMLTKKQNGFDDFIAAAEMLLRERRTCVSQLALEGGSNGGLLVTAALTQRPELFGAVVANVPLTDMVRYSELGHGGSWKGEYGSRDDPEQFRAIHAYSPYHHVGERRRFPPLLIQTADHDDRVDPAHARKFAAAVVHAQVGEGPVLLTVARSAGHGGGAALSQYVAQRVDAISFLRSQLGACKP